MNNRTRDQLLALNRQFYAAVAEPFHATRQSWPRGNVALLDYLPNVRPLRVLDAGCGNGRFAFVLDSLGAPIEYIGVDANPRLLDYAAAQSTSFTHVDAEFVRANLDDEDWPRRLPQSRRQFDIIVCLATMQHMPSLALREQILCSFARLLTPGGRLAVSAWQFLTSPRLASRQIGWSVTGIDPTQVEPGDALLPWKQDVYAIRYVHQIDLDEMGVLASAAGLHIITNFRADGREDNLNLYAIMEATTR